ncbi:hypothetical protein [Salinisphaera hydrothermalis]|uniref:hypothetical protein n=1 Tax=Salinisphaera hydrothermalis TaxID=563188 RepID=UPI003340D249
MTLLNRVGVSLLLGAFCFLPLAALASGFTYELQYSGVIVTGSSYSGVCQAYADKKGASASAKNPGMYENFVGEVVPDVGSFADGSPAPGCKYTYTYVPAGSTLSSGVTYAMTRSGSCPAGESVGTDGVCASNDPAASCPAKGAELVWAPVVSPALAQALQNSSGSVQTIQDDAGCTYSASGGVGACIADASQPGKLVCAFNYTSDHALEPSGGNDVAAVAGEMVDPADAPSGSDNSTTAPTVTSTDDPAPVTTQNADGSTTVVDSKTVTASGGGHSTFSVTSSGSTVTAVGDSSASVQTVDTSTANQDSSGTQKTSVTKSFTNGDTFVYSFAPDGSVTVTRAAGTSGSATTTTTKSVDANGNVTSTSTSSGSTAGANYACDETTGRCVYADSNGDGVGTDNTGQPCTEGNITGCQSGQGSGVEGSGTCDPSNGPCGQSGEGGQFGGSPFPSLADNQSVGDTLTGTLGKLQNAPIYQAVAGISAAVPDAGSCPFGSTHLAYLDVDIDFSSGCDLYDQNRGLLSSAAKAGWSLLGIVIILGL